MRTLALLVCVGFVGAASAQYVLWDQSAIDPGVNAIVDQDFEAAYEQYSSYMVMDVVTDAGGWNVQEVTTYFTANGAWGPGITNGMLNIFEKTGSLPAAGDDPGAGTEVALDWVFGANGWEVTAAGLDIDLAGGTEYWIGLTPMADFGTYGQEFHQAAPIVGENTAWRNPGAAFGYGGDWTYAHVLDSTFTWPDAFDAAFKVVGIPEPASLALLGLGALALIRRR